MIPEKTETHPIISCSSLTARSPSRLACWWMAAIAALTCLRFIPHHPLRGRDIEPLRQSAFQLFDRLRKTLNRLLKRDLYALHHDGQAASEREYGSLGLRPVAA